MNLWNPKTPVAELACLSDKLKQRLHGGDYRSVERLDRCPSEQLRALGYNREAVKRIHEALRRHRSDLADLADILTAEGLTCKALLTMQPFDLLGLPITATQLGYLLRWQHDVGGRYGDKDIFCVAGGRIYYCTSCPYRDERSNFCGFCTKKLLDDIAEKKRGTAP